MLCKVTVPISPNIIIEKYERGATIGAYRLNCIFNKKVGIKLDGAVQVFEKGTSLPKTVKRAVIVR
jgi:hypothetical protein